MPNRHSEGARGKALADEIQAAGGEALFVQADVAKPESIVRMVDAIDYAQQGVRVNAVCPGFTHSEMVDPVMDGDPRRFQEEVLSHVPMRRVADADEIATAVAWLLSDEASFMTGQAIVPDGGWTAKGPAGTLQAHGITGFTDSGVG